MAEGTMSEVIHYLSRGSGGTEARTVVTNVDVLDGYLVAGRLLSSHRLSERVQIGHNLHHHHVRDDSDNFTQMTLTRCACSAPACLLSDTQHT